MAFFPVYIMLAASSLLLGSYADSDSIDRPALIQSAITEVENEIPQSQEVTTNMYNVTTAFSRLRAFKMTSPEALAQGKARNKFEKLVKIAEKKIVEKEREVSVQSTDKLAESFAKELLHTPGTLLTSQERSVLYKHSGCMNFKRKVVCKAKDRKQRRVDGTCNNLKYPLFGSVDTRLRRLIPPHYGDGISKPRGNLQMEKSKLFPDPFSPPNPSARIVSTKIMKDVPTNDPQHSYMLMQWGQFLDHDITFTPEHEGCEHTCELSEECAPIPLQPEDDKVIKINGQCHEFRRSLAACDFPDDNENVDLKPRQQFNGITHFIDASNVYHHNNRISKEFLRGKDGKLKIEEPEDSNPKSSLLPLTNDVNSPVVACMTPPCFLAGDRRVNEQTSLTVMHTLWMREHNRLATIIANNNPDYSDNMVFNIARRILEAEMQKISYEEYLPLIFGTLYRDLVPEYEGYEEDVFPNVPNSFSAAAYRFGHSQIQPKYALFDENYQPMGELDLNEIFFNSDSLLKLGTDPVIRGILQTPPRNVDEFITKRVTDHLFAKDSMTAGMDLASLNVNRGRDHGIAPYIIFKEWAKTVCGLESEFRDSMTQFEFEEVYGNLYTVDLFPGGLAEKPLPGGVVGAVFACIFAETFTALRDGDRFFYKNVLTKKQLNEIKKTSLSRVICDNTYIKKIQPNAFLLENKEDNKKVKCKNIPSMNMDAWTQTDYEEDANNLLYMLKNLIKKLEEGGPVEKDSAEAVDTVMSNSKITVELEKLLEKVKK